MKALRVSIIGVFLLCLTFHAQAFFGTSGGGGGSGGGGSKSSDYQTIKNAIDNAKDLSFTEKLAYKVMLDRYWPQIEQRLAETNVNVEELTKSIKSKKDLEDFIKNLPQDPDNGETPFSSGGTGDGSGGGEPSGNGP